MKIIYFFKFIFALCLIFQQTHIRAQETVEIVDADVEYIKRGEDYDGTQDITLSDPNLSLKYVRGPFLLYDCFEQHWVCTTKFEFRNCKESRLEQIKDNVLKLNCSPVEEYASEDECVDVQRRITNRAVELRTCLHPSFQFQSKD